MTYAPFSYVSVLGGTKRYGSTVGYKCAFGYISRACEWKSVNDRYFPRSLGLVIRCVRHDDCRHCTLVSDKDHIDVYLYVLYQQTHKSPLCRSYNLITMPKHVKYNAKTKAHSDISKSYHIKRLHRRSFLHIRAHLPQLNRSTPPLRKLLPLIKDIKIPRLQHGGPLRIHHCDLRRRSTGKRILDPPMIRLLVITI